MTSVGLVSCWNIVGHADKIFNLKAYFQFLPYIFKYQICTGHFITLFTTLVEINYFDELKQWKNMP